MRPNLPIAFASVLLSVMLWFVVYTQNTPEPVPLRATLAIDGLDDARFFVRKAPSDIRLDVSMPADRVKELGDQQVTASVDLSDPKEGTHPYPVAISPSWVVRYLSGVRPTVAITVERIARRQIAVTTLVKGALSDPGLRLNDKRVLPPTVTVSGPASEVATVREARAYLDLSLIDLRRPEYQEADVIPLDADETRPPHVRVSPEIVVNSVSVGPTPSTKVASVVPDLSGVTYETAIVQANGYSLDPNTVTLAGKPAVLANVSKVPTQIVQARGLKGDRTLTVRLIAPIGTMIVGSETVKVTLRTVPAPTPRPEKTPPKPPTRIEPPFPTTVPPLR